MKHTNDHILRDYDAVLDSKYGAIGTPERDRFEEEAFAAYSGQILRDIRKEAGLTLTEVADRIGTNKSYISRIERGEIIPSVCVFYRIVSALGRQVQIVNPVA